MADLKSCPFCGGEAEILKYPRCERKYVVVCKNNLCNASIGQYSTSKDNAVRAWNTRKPMEAVVAELEKLKDDDDESGCEGVSCVNCKYKESCIEGGEAYKVTLDKAISIVRGKE